MKKILNLTRNEMIDVISEEHIVFNPPRKYKLFTEHGKDTYKISNRPIHWEDTDSYKIIEIS